MSMIHNPMKVTRRLSLLILLLSPLMAIGQGSMFVSNMGDAPIGSVAVGSNLWRAQYFVTGSHLEGYSLDSVELLMAEAFGNPSGFTVSLYNASDSVAFLYPGSLIGNLSGVDPVTPGVFRYIASPMSLDASTSYFLVVSSATPVAEGAFSWSAIASGFTSGVNGWGIGNHHFSSIDGASWEASRASVLQLAIIATPVPEPSVIGLLGLGSAVLGVRLFRRSDAEHSCKPPMAN